MLQGPSNGNLSFQDVIRHRLVERNEREHAYSSIIDQYRRLAQQTRMLKERNNTLLRAVGTVKANPNASTVLVSADENPVRAAYTTSLESQISSMRDELAAAYKAQSQATQRLIAVNDTMHRHEEQTRLDADTIQRLNDELGMLRRRVSQHTEILGEKDRTVQNLNDELAALTLEISQLENRNTALKEDNAALLSRWIDKMNSEAEKQNGMFEDEMRSHDALGDLPVHPNKTVSGNGLANGTTRAGQQGSGTTPNLAAG